MDAAPLTLAHSHARNAVQETQKSNPKTASEQHELAAGEFSNARNDTHESEAIRILSLLEQHHRQLAHVLQFDSSLDRTAKAQEDKDDVSEKPIAAAQLTPSEKDTPPSLVRTSSSPTRLRRDAHRELSSSIANKMAVARGKPSAHRRIIPTSQNPLPPQVERSVAGGERAAQFAPTLSRQSSATKESNTTRTPAPTTPKPTDEGFNRFFTSFDSLFSKLSAPLAFAGLPLTAEAAQEEAKAADKDRTLDKSRVRVRTTDNEPDLNRIYSRAALRVIKEEGGPLGIQDSFYWVPPSGGTATYANMLTTTGSDGQGGVPHLSRQGSSGIPSTIGEEDAEQEFVDAREMQGPPSPSRSRRGLRSRAGTGGASSRPGHDDRSASSNKTMEELELENTALRQLLDTQNRRLQMWEASSQAQTLALAQSMHAGRMAPLDSPPPPLPNLPAGLTTTTAAGTTTSTRQPEALSSSSDRIRELEDLLRVERAEREGLEHRGEKMARENEKLLAVLGKYREKWEQLKAGARRRDRGSVAGGSVAGGDDGGGERGSGR